MNEKDLKKLGAVLKEFRTKNELTLQEVADYFGFTHKSVQFWEQGKNEIKLSTFVELCKIYNTTPNEVLVKAGIADK